MSKAELMHGLQTLKDLSDHYFHIVFGHFFVHVSLQIAVFKIIHGDKNVLKVFEPSLECHKKFFVLETVSCYNS